MKDMGRGIGRRDELGRPLTGATREEVEILAVHRALCSLAELCTLMLSQSLQHYRMADSWSIGTLPNCNMHADALETQIQSLLSHSQLLPEQFHEASSLLKSVMSLRSVSGGARYAAQLSWLLQQDEERAHLTPFVCEVGDAAVVVARKCVAALNQADKTAAREASHLLQEMEDVRKTCQQSVVLAHNFSVPVRRVARAAIWSLAVAGVGMEQAVRRTVLKETESL